MTNSLFAMFMFLPVPATFVTTPAESVTAYKTWDTVLKCDIFGYPTPKIEWERSHKKLPVNRHVISGNKLTIKSTTEADVGSYMCRGIQQFSKTKTISVRIDVKDVGKLRIC